MTMDWVYIVGGSVFAATIRIAGVLVGRLYPCATMLRYRIVVGIALYTLAALAIAAGVAGL